MQDLSCNYIAISLLLSTVQNFSYNLSLNFCLRWAILTLSCGLEAEPVHFIHRLLTSSVLTRGSGGRGNRDNEREREARGRERERERECVCVGGGSVCMCVCVSVFERCVYVSE